MKLYACVISIAICSLLIVGNLSAGAHSEEANTTEGVMAVLNMQRDAWNRGDLDAFMTGYLDSPDTSYISGGTEVWGYKALRDRYQTRYGASRDTMGKLDFSDLIISALGSDHALCVGHWHLERPSQPAADGVYSLVLMHEKDGWKIMHDHTSVIDKKQ